MKRQLGEIARARGQMPRGTSRRLAVPMVLVAVLAVAIFGFSEPSGAEGVNGHGASTRAQLERAIDNTFAEVSPPGVIVGVKVGNHQAFTATRGVSDLGTKAPVTLGLHTRIGSVTKTFTGTLILQLVDEGKIRLDETIQNWFPQLPDANAITIRDLGSMSSGIASYTSNTAFVNEYLADPTRAWTPEELVAAGTSLPRLFSPGHGFFYSNTNFVMLGLIIEQVTGQPYPAVLQARILDPLKLNSTMYPDTDELAAPFWHGYTDQGSTNGQLLDATNWSPTIAAYAGQMVSTLGDVMTWARAVGRGELISPAAQQDRLQGNPASESGKREYDFAIGSDNGWLVHDGDIPGYNSQIAYLPKLDITIVVLVNSDTSAGGAPPAPIFFSALASVVAPSNVP